MKKTRYLAGVLAALLLAALLTGCGSKKPEGIFYEASGIDPDETILALAGQEISAQEYLYWLAYECESLTSSRGTVKWDDVIEDGVTYGEYAKRSAVTMLLQFAVARAVAESNGITLTEEDREALQKDKEDAIERSGGREEYLRHLAMMGVSEEVYDHINEGYKILDRVVEVGSTEGSKLYPTDEALEEYAEGKSFVTVRMITLPTADLDEEALAAQQELLEDCASQIREAEDRCAKLEELAVELGQTDGGTDKTLGADIIDPKIMKAVSELEENEVSDVITTRSAMCIALRRPLDRNAIARECFSMQLLATRSNAKVEVSESYKTLDAGKFYTALVELRQTMFAENTVKN